MSGRLEISGVTKQFDGVVAVDDLSLAIEPGRITGLIGPNGAGKTTLFNLISGFLRPDHGAIALAARRIDHLPPWDIARLGVGRLFQDVRVFDKLSVLDNVRVASGGQPGENPLWALVAWRRVRQAEGTATATAKRWLDFVGLAQNGLRWAQDLSYGEQKLLAIARVLASDASLLLLDEPTAGIHPHLADKVLDCIRDLRAQGRTILIIEHDLQVIADLCDEVCLLDRGRLLLRGVPSEILGDSEARRVYVGQR
jgi:ABC-type branched-subunit amino acid transport system ATPase component